MLFLQCKKKLSINSLICPKTKSANHCLTELFPIYQNKQWTIKWREDRSVDPSSLRIMLKIVNFKIVSKLLKDQDNCFRIHHNCIHFLLRFLFFPRARFYLKLGFSLEFIILCTCIHFLLYLFPKGSQGWQNNTASSLYSRVSMITVVEFRTKQGTVS